MSTEPVALTEAQVLDCLRQVLDPEIGYNIVDLGLVYDVRPGPGRIDVQMTLTTPGCPMHETILEGVRSVLLSIPGITDADVTLVWDPPWHPTLMSPEAREMVGGRL